MKKPHFNIIDPFITLGFQDRYPFYTLEIQPLFAPSKLSDSIKIHLYQIENLLKRLIPSKTLLHKEKKPAFLKWAQAHLPLIHKTECPTTPDYLALYYLCKHSKTASLENMFHLSIRRILSPGKKLKFPLSITCTFPYLSSPQTTFFWTKLTY